MAKLTLFFKGTPIHVYHVDSGSVHIGRDESNTIRIDSLAVAPAHAAIVISDGTTVITQLNDGYPVIVNNQTIKKCNLTNGDMISIGKHVITYSDDTTVLERSNSGTFDGAMTALEHEISESQHHEANLQVISGRYIGRVIPLKRALTRLGKAGHGVAVIAKRKDGYFVSALEGGNLIKINTSLIEDNSIKLSDGDIVEINKTSMQFFAGI